MALTGGRLLDLPSMCIAGIVSYRGDRATRKP
jgi:hypothetical protein